MNRLRVTLIRNALTGHTLDDTGLLPNSDVFPLAGKRIIDVGCGPGILCEVKSVAFFSEMCIHLCTYIFAAIDPILKLIYVV